MEKSLELIEAPMKVLDDMSICEERAKLRVKNTTRSLLTPSEKEGKKWWYRERERYLRFLKSTFKEEDRFITHKDSIEHHLVLSYVGEKYVIEMHGSADIVLFTSLKCKPSKKEFYMPLLFLFEFTLFRNAVTTVKTRLEAYATALYGIYGYPTIPILIIVERENAYKGELYVLRKDSIFSNTLIGKLRRLEKLIKGEIRPKHAPKDVCTSCDINLRRMCPYF